MDIGTFLYRSFDNRNTGAQALNYHMTIWQWQSQTDHESNLIFLGVLVTGGDDDEGGRSVDVIREDGTTCSLPDLPSGRFRHTSSGLTVCGNELSGNKPNKNKCSTFSNGQWKTSHYLSVPREESMSWESPDGIILMAGAGDAGTTEKLSKTTSSTVTSFALAYATM